MFDRGESGPDLEKMIAESAEAPANEDSEQLRPEEFAPTQEQQAERKKAEQKEFRERQVRSVKESVKSVVDILKTSPDLMGSALKAAQTNIEGMTNLPEEQARELLKSALNEVIPNLAPDWADSELPNRINDAIKSLEQQETAEELPEAA